MFRGRVHAFVGLEQLASDVSTPHAAGTQIDNSRLDILSGSIVARLFA